MDVLVSETTDFADEMERIADEAERFGNSQCLQCIEKSPEELKERRRRA